MVMKALVLDKPAPSIELAVGLRTYLEIVKVEAPSAASYGDTVTINIYVRNKWTSRIFAIVTGQYDTTPVTSTSHYIDPGAQRIFGLSFTMPNKSVDLWLWAWYWTETGWSTSPDDEYGPVTIGLSKWVLLASKTLTVKYALPPVVGWTLLASRTLTVTPTVAPPPVGWALLASKTLTVSPTPPPAVGWVLLDSKTVAVTAGPLSANYELIVHIITPQAYFYEGDAEVASMAFTLITGTTWVALEMANKFADELEARGSQLLEGEFYKDATPLTTDRYLVKISYVVPSGVSGVGTSIGFYIPPIVWEIIFWVALSALVAFLISRAVNWVKSMFYSPPPLSEEVKKEWSKETLTSMITDLRPEYSPEELAGKTDQELRDILDKIYEELVPSGGIPWWGWVIIGGVGIAGTSLALRFLPKKKKEEVKSKGKKKGE
jgi:hypothetical protein